MCEWNNVEQLLENAKNLFLKYMKIRTLSSVLVYLQGFQVAEFFECSRLNVCDAVIGKRSAAEIKEGYCYV